MVASPLAATVVTAILRCNFCAAKGWHQTNRPNVEKMSKNKFAGSSWPRGAKKSWIEPKMSHNRPLALVRPYLTSLHRALAFGLFLRHFSEMARKTWSVLQLNAHSSTRTPVFLTSREETQAMVREKLGPKPRPPQTLYLPGKGETEFLGRKNSDRGLSLGCFWGRVDEGDLKSWKCAIQDREETKGRFRIRSAPIGAFFCPEIRAFTGFGPRVPQPFPQSLVTVKYNSSTKRAVNTC